MSREPSPEPWSDEDFREIAALLRSRHVGTLPLHRMGLLRSRLRAQLQARGIPSFTWFNDHEIRDRPNGAGMQVLIDLGTVNHTSFFREAARLHFLAERLAERLRSGRIGPVRVWSAGCSAGQEPYSLAMDLAELVSGLGPEHLEVWASDLSLEMIRTAARAIYRARDLGHIPPERLRRFFLRGRGPRHGTYRIVPEIRRLVTFQHFDLRSPEWPISSDFDAVLCRNVVIYFTDRERLILMDRLANRLRDGGWLVVGNCEILPERPGLLQKLAPSLFRKVSTP